MSQTALRTPRTRDPVTVLVGLAVFVLGGLAWHSAAVTALACAGLAGFSLSGSP